jgi:lysophospholipase L1-like esterase
LKVRQRVYRRVARSARRVHGRGPLLVAIGDSLTDPQCAYTLPRQVWPRIVGRAGYRTVNLGVSGETTADMRRRIEQTLSEGQPEIAVLFGGANDAIRGVGPAETEQNVTFMVEWLRERGIRKIAVIGPGLLNWGQTPDWVSAADEVRKVLRDVAERYGAIFVDLAMFLRHRIDRGKDPDFARVPYRQARSWHVQHGDPHFNAYGQRLVAEAFLEATSDWRPPPRGTWASALLATRRPPRRPELPSSDIGRA